MRVVKTTLVTCCKNQKTYLKESVVPTFRGLFIFVANVTNQILIKNKKKGRSLQRTPGTGGLAHWYLTQFRVIEWETHYFSCG